MLSLRETLTWALQICLYFVSANLNMIFNEFLEKHGSSDVIKFCFETLVYIFVATHPFSISTENLTLEEVEKCQYFVLVGFPFPSFAMFFFWKFTFPCKQLPPCKNIMNAYNVGCSVVRKWFEIANCKWLGSFLSENIFQNFWKWLLLTASNF